MKTESNNTWIPVSENPPELTPLLVFGRCCEIHRSVRIAELDGNEWFESFSGDDLPFIPSHYMTIPEIPTI